MNDIRRKKQKKKRVFVWGYGDVKALISMMEEYDEPVCPRTVRKALLFMTDSRKARMIRELASKMGLRSTVRSLVARGGDDEE